PLGKATLAQQASTKEINDGNSLCIITYGMGVYWAKNSSKKFPGSVEILDLRTLNPCDDEAVFESVRRHGKCIVLTEEQIYNSFAQALAGRISYTCFRHLDAPVKAIGSKPLPAVALIMILEKAMLPSVEMVSDEISALLKS
ncbi:MAG: tungsten formylmethanofuran dehydrogenase, partial [Chitinophagales bacterium]|nr:tungsten formylmethanofuran dehydrogenase [Chitinophagales bacterium]